MNFQAHVFLMNLQMKPLELQGIKKPVRKEPVFIIKILNLFIAEL